MRARGILSRHPALTRYLAATIVYCVALAACFHAILLHPGSRLYGLNDGTAAILEYWDASAQHRDPFNFTLDRLNGAPEGLALAPATTLANGGLQAAFVWELRGPLGLIGATNTFLLIGMLATALAMFWFLTRLGCSLLASLLGGYVFAFSPYAFERAYAGHLALLQNWVFPLLALILLRLRERRSILLAATAGLTIALAFYLSAYQGLFAAFMASVFLLLELGRPARAGSRLRTLRLAAASAVTGLAALTPIFVLYASERTEVDASVNHPGSQLFEFSASLGGYFLPSTRNPLYHWIHHVNLRPTDDTLFFGYLTLLLALTGIVLLFRGDAWIGASPTRRRAALAAAVLVPAAFVMSLRPSYHIGALEIPTPVDVFSHLTTFWRQYARFGLLVGFALITLAALTLTTLGRRPARRWRALTPLAALIIVLEVLPGNVPLFDGTAVPVWVTWLASHPRGIVVTYPWIFGDQLVADDWYQIYDRDPQFAAPLQPGRAGGIHLLARDLFRPLTAGILATEGVRYVIVHDDALAGSLDTPDPNHYTLLANFGLVQIYSVHSGRVNIARALRENAGELATLQGVGAPALDFGSGYNAPELNGGISGRWMIQDGQLILSAATPTDVTLSGLAFSNQRPRLLELRDAAGRVLGRASVGLSATPIRVGPFRIPAGRTTLTLVALPGPGFMGPSDPREASVFIDGPLTATPWPPYITGSASA